VVEILLFYRFRGGVLLTGKTKPPAGDSVIFVVNLLRIFLIEEIGLGLNNCGVEVYCEYISISGTRGRSLY
jgi:hypothetical protein